MASLLGGSCYWKCSGFYEIIIKNYRIIGVDAHCDI